MKVKKEGYEKLIKELKQDVTGEFSEMRSRSESFSIRDDFESRVIQIE